MGVPIRRRSQLRGTGAVTDRSGKQQAPSPEARASAVSPGPVHERYEATVASGAIERDPAQARLVRALDRLVVDLQRRKRASKTSALGWLFRRKDEAEALKGLYVWGSVGRGKTMLMDLFHEAAPEPKTWMTIEEVGHNDVQTPEAERAVLDFLAQLPEAAPAGAAPAALPPISACGA